jgi:hypothetical protein
MRETQPGMAGATETPREARRDQNEGGLDDRDLEPRRDERPAGGESDARSEMRETQPGMAGATENPS